MRRNVIILGFCVVTGLSIWLFARRFTIESSRPGANIALGNATVGPEHGDEEDASHTEFVLQLPVTIAYFDKDRISPCYLDVDRKTAYCWKGVILRVDQVPRAYTGIPSRVSTIKAKGFNIESFEAPIKYIRTKDGYRAGYLDTTSWDFFAWKGVMLKEDALLEKSADGQPALITTTFPTIGVIEIDMPSHLKEEPNQWKKM